MKSLKLVAVLAAFVLVVAACGDDDSGSETTAAPTTTAATDDTTATTAAPTTTAAPAPEGYMPSGGNLLILQWQAPSQANSLLSSGTKDLLAGSLVLEPLVDFAPSGDAVARLVTEVPTVANGGIPEDFTSITYNLIPDVVWSDGSPFTSADVVFSYEFCLDEATGCSAQPDPNIDSVEALDDLTVRVNFIDPQPFPFVIFSGYTSPIISQAQFGECIGAAASGCTEQNFGPLGTGPYTITELRAEDTVLYTYNPNYRGLADGKPYFDSVELKGGGDAEASARSVLEIGEADYGWNLQVAPEILLPMEEAGNGTIVTSFTANVEHINLNGANNRADAFRSEYLEDCEVGATPFACNENPFFFRNTVLHDAMSMAIDRDSIVAVGYGPAGSPTCNIWPVGSENSPNNDAVCQYDPAAANAMLDDAGWVDTDGDGIRNNPDTGDNLSFSYVTSTNAVRQSTQAIIKENWDAIGIETDMRNEDASLFFDGTCASDACIWKFFEDIQMFTNGAINSYAAGYLSGWLIRELPTEAKAWGGSNLSRLYEPEFDDLWATAASTPLDDPGQDGLIHQLNDAIVEWNIIPLVHRGNVSAISNRIGGFGEPNGWSSEYWNIADWVDQNA